MAQPMVILVPTDGSDCAQRALAFAIELAKLRGDARIELLNVQPGVRGSVSMFVSKAELDAYHRDEAMTALQPALDAAKQAGVACDHHIAVGEPGPVIAAFAKRLSCTQVVMGVRGLGSAFDRLLGSFASETLAHVDLPVTLVR